MKFRIEHIVILGLFAWVIFQTTCSPANENIKTNREVYRDSTTTVIVDSFETENSHNNIPSIRVIDSLVLNYKTIKIYDTLSYEPIPLGLDTFKYFINDSLMNANITAFSKEKPYIDFNYKIKHFEIKTNTIVKDSIYTKSLKSYMSIGATLIGNGNNFGFAPELNYIHKCGNTFSLGYDVINKNIHLGFSKRISFKK